MRGIASVSNKFFLPLLGLMMIGCTQDSTVTIRTVPIQQNWELQPGAMVGTHRIAGSLGDISIQLQGDRVYAPFDGQLQRNDINHCYIFSSPDVPAYLFRLCGLRRAQVGQVQQGDTLGTADYLQFAALRRQPDGKWAMVEPARDILERTLVKR